MRAIELISKTDKKGHLNISYQLNKSDKNVRIIILLEEDKTDAEKESIWLKAIEGNQAFDFLNDPAEDIYTIKDGEPIND